MVARQLGRSSQIAGLEDRVARRPAFGCAVRDTEGLARQVGMSRTAFAARFRESVGEPPAT